MSRKIYFKKDLCRDFIFTSNDRKEHDLIVGIIPGKFTAYTHCLRIIWTTIMRSFNLEDRSRKFRHSSPEMDLPVRDENRELYGITNYSARFVAKSIAIVAWHAIACNKGRLTWPEKSLANETKKSHSAIISQIRKLFLDNSIGLCDQKESFARNNIWGGNFPKNVSVLLIKSLCLSTNDCLLYYVICCSSCKAFSKENNVLFRKRIFFRIFFRYNGHEAKYIRSPRKEKGKTNNSKQTHVRG